jgi:Tol biopolymer transport system component
MADADEPILKIGDDGEIEGGLPLPEGSPKKKKGVPTVLRRITRNPVVTVISRLLIAGLSLMGIAAVKSAIDTANANRCPTAADLHASNGRIVYVSSGSERRYLVVAATPEPFLTVVPDPQEREFAAVPDREGKEIYVLDLDGSNLRRLTNNRVEDRRPVLSPDGHYVAYEAVGHGIAIADTSNPDRFLSIPVSSTSVAEIAWSPDSKRIAISSNIEMNKFAIDIMNVDGSNRRHQVLNLALLNMIWSPDGLSIYFRSSPPKIHITDVDFVNQRILAAGTASAFSVSPDGKRIALIDGGNLDVMNADGTGRHRLVDAIGVWQIPVWSPDSQRLAFTAYVNDGSEIFIVNANNPGSMTQITHSNVGNHSPQWLPDGKHLVFVSRRYGIDDEGGIYVIDDDGSNQQRLCARWPF